MNAKDLLDLVPMLTNGGTEKHRWGYKRARQAVKRNVRDRLIKTLKLKDIKIFTAFGYVIDGLAGIDFSIQVIHCLQAVGCQYGQRFAYFLSCRALLGRMYRQRTLMLFAGLPYRDTYGTKDGGN